MTSTLILRAYFEIVTVHTFVRKIIPKAHLESAGYTHCMLLQSLSHIQKSLVFVFLFQASTAHESFPSRDTWWLFYFINNIVALGLYQKYT